MEALAFNDFESFTSWNFRLKMFPTGSVQALYTYNHSFTSGYKRAPSDTPSDSVPDPVRSASNSLKRSIQQVYELAKSNSFQYFVTFTFNDNFLSGLTDDYLANYSIYSSAMADFTHWLSISASRSCSTARWIIIPELHQSKRYHFHGIISADFLELVHAVNPHTGRKIYSHGRKVYNLKSFDWGYTTVTEIVSNSAAANYITKYFTKNLRSAAEAVRLLPKGKKRYWASRNLHKPNHVYLNLNVREVAERFASSSSYSKTLYTPVGKMSFFEFREADAPKFADYCEFLSPQFNKIFIKPTSSLWSDSSGVSVDSAIICDTVTSRQLGVENAPAFQRGRSDYSS